MDVTVVESRRASILAERIFSLEEPWRSRFLNLIVDRAALSTVDGGVPNQMTVQVWLQDPKLYNQVCHLLGAWTHT
jgi:hypothetical protein